ncbi:MAG: Rrf2 family transcriptional regulator [Candidatus Poribacteria bacterium]|nr:Rrf2 family transcriptional regulator [Candidatus Poribacteria bacterium]
MQLSAKLKYAVCAMLELGLQYHKQFVSVTVLSEKRSIPGPYLEKLLLQLKHAGLTTSRRGPDGGYSLALPPDQIRIGDIFAAVAGPVNFTEGFESQESSEIGDFFAEIEEEVCKVLNTKTLHELCCHARKINQLSAPTHSHPFSI